MTIARTLQVFSPKGTNQAPNGGLSCPERKRPSPAFCDDKEGFSQCIHSVCLSHLQPDTIIHKDHRAIDAMHVPDVDDITAMNRYKHWRKTGEKTPQRIGQPMALSVSHKDNTLFVICLDVDH